MVVDVRSAATMKETTTLTLRESAAFLATNDYLRDVAILVVAYGTSINIVEGMGLTVARFCRRVFSRLLEAFSP